MMALNLSMLTIKMSVTVLINQGILCADLITDKYSGTYANAYIIALLSINQSFHTLGIKCIACTHMSMSCVLVADSLQIHSVFISSLSAHSFITYSETFTSADPFAMWAKEVNVKQQTVFKCDR